MLPPTLLPPREGLLPPGILPGRESPTLPLVRPGLAAAEEAPVLSRLAHAYYKRHGKYKELMARVHSSIIGVAEDQQKMRRDKNKEV